MKDIKIAEKLIRKLIRKKYYTPKKLSLLKREFSKKYQIPLLSNITLIKAYRQLLKNKKINKNNKVLKLLRRRDIRTLSGVSIITVLTKPYKCPGNCIYCPNEKDMPKSYLKKEPAAQRAYLNKFDPYKQVQTRIKSLILTGHPVDKIEMIVLGGSWTAYPKKYKTWFIKRCFDACNYSTSKTLEQAQKKNEKAKHRIIGLSLETRPDLIDEKEAYAMRKLGCTRVELGVQTIYPKILKKINRQATLKDTVKATKILKQFGFKVVYHLMPNLPDSTPAKDLKRFKTIFSDSRFQPDMLKIYPCVVLKTAKLYKIWKNKKYKPYSQKTLNKLLINIKKNIPSYVRINRLIRDIPSDCIEAGNKVTNLRQIIQKEYKHCQCIRCREAREKPVNNKIKFVKRKYKASKATEHFLSFESKDKKTLYAFLRLRLPQIKNIKPAPAAVPAVTPETAMIRELHTYGQSLPLPRRSGANTRPKAVQHLGLGKKLMEKAEKIAKQKGCQKIAVISGIGVRGYYRKLGYRLKHTYMVKKIK